MADYRVVTAKLRDEAKRWEQWSDDTRPIVQAVQAAYLSPAAFFVGDLMTLGAGLINADLEAGQYEEFRVFMEGMLQGAMTEFNQIGIVLRKIADEYDRIESVTELDIDQTYHA